MADLRDPMPATRFAYRDLITENTSEKQDLRALAAGQPAAVNEPAVTVAADAAMEPVAIPADAIVETN